MIILILIMEKNIEDRVEKKIIYNANIELHENKDKTDIRVRFLLIEKYSLQSKPWKHTDYQKLFNSSLRPSWQSTVRGGSTRRSSYYNIKIEGVWLVVQFSFCYIYMYVYTYIYKCIGKTEIDGRRVRRLPQFYQLGIITCRLLYFETMKSSSSN